MMKEKWALRQGGTLTGADALPFQYIPESRLHDPSEVERLRGVFETRCAGAVAEDGPAVKCATDGANEGEEPCC